MNMLISHGIEKMTTNGSTVHIKDTTGLDWNFSIHDILRTSLIDSGNLVEFTLEVTGTLCDHRFIRLSRK
jgi:hypothetical protein